MMIFRLQLQAKLKTNKWKSTKLQEIVKVYKNVLWWPSTWYVTNIYLATIKSVTLDQFPNAENVFKTILGNARNLSEIGINCPEVRDKNRALIKPFEYKQKFKDRVVFIVTAYLEM